MLSVNLLNSIHSQCILLLSNLRAGEESKFLSVWGQYTFQIVLIGTIFLGIAASLLGTFNVLKGQALIGDAVGHSTYPGIILAYMIFLSRSPLLLSLGASIAGLLAYYVVHLIGEKSRLSSDTAMAIVLSSFFAFGSVLNAHISSSERYKNSAQAGLKNYIFGQAADMMKIDVIVIIVSSCLCILFVLVCYKELKLTVFDPVFTRSIGFKPQVFNYLILIFTLILIAQGLKTVGIILISSLFIAPCIAAQQWTCKISRVLLLSAVFAIVSALIGVWVSSAVNRVSTGPSIVICLSLIVFVSSIFGSRSSIFTLLKQRCYRKEGNGK